MDRWEHLAVLCLRGGAQLWTGCLRDAVMETSRKTRQNETRQDRRKRIFPGTQQAPADSVAPL